MTRIAILITCFNRKAKTISCLDSIYRQNDIDNIFLDVYVVDDNSKDDTVAAIKKNFPDVNIINGTGDLFWAGGMRLAWQTAIDSKIDYKYFLLLNDDTVLDDNAINYLLADVNRLRLDEVIIVGTTVDSFSKDISYGGRVLSNRYNTSYKTLKPNDVEPQLCDLGNANIFLVSYNAYQKLGILSNRYTHGIADYDYTLRARKHGIPTFVASHVLGYCTDDHSDNWSKQQLNLKQRIAYLYSVKGLAYNEYLLFIKSHFPIYLPQAWFLLWLKTLFPIIWEKTKK